MDIEGWTDHMSKLRIASVLAVGLVLAACGGGDDAAEKIVKPGKPAEVTGEITVLTQRTDIVDTVFQDYKKKFEAKYPGINVKFEAITDYEGEVRIRMNTKDYGDVLLIPNSVTPDQLPTFFEPLGTVDELQGQVPVRPQRAGLDGKVYGLAITGNAQGFVYNKKVWQQAGITAPPKTPDEFLAALQAIKDKTDAIPLYTNYKDGWPLDPVGGQPRCRSAATPTRRSSWPRTTRRGLRARSTTSSTRCCSTSCKAGPDRARPDDHQLGAAPRAARHRQDRHDDARLLGDRADAGRGRPTNRPTSATCRSRSRSTASSTRSIGGDYKNAININSKNKAAARAWIDWFADESGLRRRPGRRLRRHRRSRCPTTLADFDRRRRRVHRAEAAPKGEEGLVNRIDNAGRDRPVRPASTASARRRRARREEGDQGRDLRRPEQEVGRRRAKIAG